MFAETREKRVAAVSLSSKIILLSSRQNYLKKKVDCIQHHNVEK
jgi:hypothetical protein